MIKELGKKETKPSLILFFALFFYILHASINHENCYKKEEHTETSSYYLATKALQAKKNAGKLVLQARDSLNAA